MKKAISVILSCLVLICAMSATAYAAEPLKVVTTIFPPYDFVRQIAGDLVDVTMLLKPGSESHSYEPSPQDIIAIQESDVFVHAGGDGDAWVEQILSSMDTGSTVLTMTHMVDTVEEEIVEGMEHSHGEDGHSHEEEAFDPAKVYDRSLTEWTGAWKSLAPYVADGSLDSYIQSGADTAEVSFDEQKTGTMTRWATDDFDTFTVAGDKVYLDTGDATYSGAYQSEGYAILETENGASVWYQYSLADGAQGMPKYIIFNDHGYGTSPEGEHTDEHADEHAHDHDHGVAHTHFRYGDTSLEELVNAQGWNPFFVDASATVQDILDTLTGHSHSHDHAHEDEHVWTSPRNAITIVKALADTLSSLDSENAATYQANADAYIQELEALDKAFADVVADAARHTLVFGDRFPFRYLVDAYGLDYYAAFTGCSTNADASASTIAFLIDKVRDESIPVVFKIELSNGQIAQTIAESTNAKVLELNSAHNLPKSDFDAGVTYLDVMYKNVDQLKEALQ